jgi:hypothetical protein
MRVWEERGRCDRYPRPARCALGLNHVFAVPKSPSECHATVGAANGLAAASGAQAPLGPLAGSASTNAKAPDERCRSPGSVPKEIFPAGAFSSKLSFGRTISHPTHVPPPGGSSYRCNFCLGASHLPSRIVPIRSSVFRGRRDVLTAAARSCCPQLRAQ